jgi:3-dehydroquinate synthetase
VEAKISELSGILPNNHYLAIKELFHKLNIFGSQLKQFDVTDIIAATKQDKKNQQGTVRYLLLKNIGEIHTEDHDFAFPIKDNVVREAYKLASEA